MGLGASVLTSGTLFWHLGSTFGVVLASRDNSAGSWEQQDGLEVVNNRIFVDFGMLLGPACVSFWRPKFIKMSFLFRLVSRSFLTDFRFEILTFGTLKTRFSH